MHRAIFACGLFAALAVIAGSGVAVAEWDPIQRLTETEANSNLPGIGKGFAVHTPYIHILHSDRNNAGEDKLFYRRSATAGATWDERVEIEEKSLAFTFSLAADKAGNVHIINARNPAGLWYRRSTDNGTTWQDATQLSPTSTTPILLTGGTQNVYVFDPELSDGLFLRMLKSTDGGANWTGPHQLLYQPGFSSLSGHADANGNIYLTWAHSNDSLGNSSVYTNRSTDNGENWTSSFRLTGRSAVPIAIRFDGIDHVYVSYTTSRTSHTILRSTNSGTSWSPVDPGTILSGMVVDRKRTVHGIAAVENDKIYYQGSEHRGAYWSDTTRISTLDPGIRAKPHIDLGGDTLHCVWNSRSTGKVQVVYRRHPGLPIGVSENPGRVDPHRAFRLSPNPVRTTVELKGNSPVTLFDESGSRIAKLSPGINNVALLPRGIYFARGSETESPAKLVKLQ